MSLVNVGAAIIDHLDISLPLSGLVVVFIYWLGSKLYEGVAAKAKVWDDHIRECNEKRIHHAVLEQKVTNIEEKVDTIGGKLDDLNTIGGKLDDLKDIMLKSVND